MSDKNINIELIEKNLKEISEGEYNSIEKEIEELEKAKKENILEKEIERLQQQIESIKQFIAEGGLDKKIEEAKEKLKSSKTSDVQATLKGKPTLVDFWADWCAPCKYIGQTVHQLKEKYKDSLNVVKIDTETKVGNMLYLKYAGAFGVNAIPFLLLFDKDGKYVDQLLGADPKKLNEMVENIV
ncbi:MAG: thioredoxin family protein [Candidatus Helarchaeota archaeon]